MGGISGIKEIFLTTKDKINSLSGEVTTNLNNKKEEAELAKNNFEDVLDSFSNLIKEETSYKKVLSTLTDSSKNGDYYLDIVKQFGTFNKTSKEANPEISLTKSWYEEYRIIAQNSEDQMGTVNENYNDLINEKKTATDALEEGVSSIESIESSFDSIKDSISQAIIDYSEIIEKYGKLGFKVVFSALMVIDAIIAAFITLRIFTQFLNCKNLCLNCFLKSLIHILWNILALLTFFTLFLGFIFTLLGTIGKDLISAVKFLVSEENLSKNNEALLISDAAEYLTTCIDGDGDLKKTLNLNIDSINIIENLKNASNDLEILKENTTELLNNKFAYNTYKTDFDKRINFEIDDFKLISNSKSLELKEYINGLNQDVNDEWKISCEADKHSCDNPSSDGNYCIELSSCKGKTLNDWYSIDTDNKKIVNAFIESIQSARKEPYTIENENSNLASTSRIENVLEILDDRYTKFLKSQTGSIDVFINTINDLTGIFIRFAGDEGGIFSMLNCLFIGKNVKVILKYLEESLGTNIYSVGVCMLITGIAMCFSIAFTILLNIIINVPDKTPSGEEIPELNNNGNDPNVNLENYAQGNYDTEKANYAENNNQNNYNEENFEGGVRVINYNN